MRTNVKIPTTTDEPNNYLRLRHQYISHWYQVIIIIIVVVILIIITVFVLQNNVMNYFVDVLEVLLEIEETIDIMISEQQAAFEDVISHLSALVNKTAMGEDFVE